MCITKSRLRKKENQKPEDTKKYKKITKNENFDEDSAEVRIFDYKHSIERVGFRVHDSLRWLNEAVVEYFTKEEILKSER